jgi:hypothetical protein
VWKGIGDYSVLKESHLNARHGALFFGSRIGDREEIWTYLDQIMTVL